MTATLSDPLVERDLIGCLLAAPEALPLVADVITSEDFASPKAREVFEVVVELDAGGQTPDVLTVTSELSRRGTKLDPLYVRDLAAEAPAAPHLIVRQRAKNIARLSSLRALQHSLANAVEELPKATDPATFAANLASAVIDATASRGVELRPIDTLVSDALADLEAQMTGTADAPPRTGFYGLDAKLGGLRPGWLTIVAARPGNGKSSLATAIARNIAVHRPVLLCSLEMSAEEIAMRMLCAEAGVRTDALIRSQGSLDDMQRVVTSLDALSGVNLSVVDRPSLTVPEIRALVRRTPDVGLVVVDYLQLMGASERKRGQSREAEVAEISRGLKVLAREAGVPILACCQLNRNVEQRADKRPTLADLRESGAIEQDADVVILLHRDTDPGKVDAIIAKHRSGPTGKVALLFQYEYTRFRDYTEGM